MEDSLMNIRKIIFYITGTAACILLVLTGGLYTKRLRLQQGIAEKILRFHVLAESDSKEDQRLKLKVRDAVGSYMEAQLANADSREMCEEIVTAHLDEIVTIAEKVVAEEGYDYEVTAALKEVDFPVKTYGAYTFPAGKYEALKVTIGSGSGHNWWCVMYPNMCFSGSVYEVVEEDAGEALKEVLTKEEYEEVFSGGKVKVEFKYLTFLNELFD
jgi:stage II sporulation protein R